MLFFVVDVISMKQKVMMDQINQVSYGLDIDSSRWAIDNIKYNIL